MPQLEQKGIQEVELNQDRIAKSTKVRISAANRLRNEVLKMPGVVLISQAGYPDRVIRFSRIPESLVECRRDGYDYVFVNLDWGPAQAAWEAAMMDVQQTARRDRPVPNPAPVAPECKDEWSLGPEDVPLIENAIIVPSNTSYSQAPVASFIPSQPPAVQLVVQPVVQISPPIQELKTDVTRDSESQVTEETQESQIIQASLEVKPETINPRLTCDICGATIKNQIGMHLHKGRFHKTKK